MTAPRVYVCDEADARALTDQIKTSVEKTWRLLLNAHEWKAWAALGYGTWEAYVRAEFGIGRSRSYQLLDQAQVVREIEAAAMSTVVDISEREARDLKPHLTEVTNAVREAVADVPEPERPAAAAQAVKDVREKHRPQPSPAPASTPAETAAPAGRDPIGAGEPDVGHLPIQDHPDYGGAPPSLTDLAGKSPKVDPDADLRARCSKDVAAIADLILTNPAEAARIAQARGVLPAWRVTFREHAKWIAAFENALTPGLKAVR